MRNGKVRVVIVGGSFGGLTTAYELRKWLALSKCEITVISKDRRFVFVPSLPWVAIGSKTLEKISFDLEKPLGRKNIDFVHAAMLRVDPQEQTVITDEGKYSYDYLVIATGHRSANEAVPGLGPFDGPGHSLMSAREAEEARGALDAFLENPGPMVIGCAPGVSCIGPAYEFAFEIDHLLRKKKLRHKVPIAFVTPEPSLGHFGIGGIGKVRQFMEGEFDWRDISYHTSVAVSKVTESSVELANGKTFESQFSMIIPPLAGVKAITDSPGLGNQKGFIPVDEFYRHGQFPNVYAVGVAVALPPVDETQIPVNFPKTGHMTEQMANIAAQTIVADIQGGETLPRHLLVECILAMGSTAVRIKADPVRPPRNIVKVSEGKRWLWAKRAFEHYYLWRAKRGKSMFSGWGW